MNRRVRQTCVSETTLQGISSPGSSVAADRALSSSGMFKVEVELKRGHNLAIRDRGGSSDPYVKIKLGGKEVYRSRTIHRNLNPVWDEKTTILVECLSEPLLVKVFDYDFALHDDFMGAAPLQLDSLELHRTVPVTLLLKDPQCPDEDLGTLELSVTLRPKDSPVEERRDAAAVSVSLPSLGRDVSPDVCTVTAANHLSLETLRQQNHAAQEVLETNQQATGPASGRAPQEVAALARNRQHRSDRRSQPDPDGLQRSERPVRQVPTGPPEVPQQDAVQDAASSVAGAVRPAPVRGDGRRAGDHGVGPRHRQEGRLHRQVSAGSLLPGQGAHSPPGAAAGGVPGQRGAAGHADGVGARVHRRPVRHAAGRPAGAPGHPEAIQPDQVLLKREGRGGRAGQGHSSRRTDGRRRDREERPVLRAGAQQRPAADPHGLQEPEPRVEQSLHLQREGRALGAGGQCVRRGPGPERRLPGPGGHPAAERAERRDQRLCAEEQGADGPHQGNHLPGDRRRLQHREGGAEVAGPRREEVHRGGAQGLQEPAAAELPAGEEVHHGPLQLRLLHQQLLRVGVCSEEPALLHGVCAGGVELPALHAPSVAAAAAGLELLLLVQLGRGRRVHGRRLPECGRGGGQRGLGAPLLHGQALRHPGRVHRRAERPGPGGVARRAHQEHLQLDRAFPQPARHRRLQRGLAAALLRPAALPGAGLGRQQVHQEAAQPVPDRQQRAAGLPVASAVRRPGDAVPPAEDGPGSESLQAAEAPPQLTRRTPPSPFSLLLLHQMLLFCKPMLHQLFFYGSV
ncbi:uncharacterized protein ACB058_004514 isoform 1-T1 [Synchiropus picturatus]